MDVGVGVFYATRRLVNSYHRNTMVNCFCKSTGEFVGRAHTIKGCPNKQTATATCPGNRYETRERKAKRTVQSGEFINDNGGVETASIIGFVLIFALILFLIILLIKCYLLLFQYVFVAQYKLSASSTLILRILILVCGGFLSPFVGVGIGLIAEAQGLLKSPVFNK
jgi:hypothetical protein